MRGLLRAWLLFWTRPENIANPTATKGVVLSSGANMRSTAWQYSVLSAIKEPSNFAPLSQACNMAECKSADHFQMPTGLIGLGLSVAEDPPSIAALRLHHSSWVTFFLRHILYHIERCS